MNRTAQKIYFFCIWRISLTSLLKGRLALGVVSSREPQGSDNHEGGPQVPGRRGTRGGEVRGLRSRALWPWAPESIRPPPALLRLREHSSFLELGKQFSRCGVPADIRNCANAFPVQRSCEGVAGEGAWPLRGGACGASGARRAGCGGGDGGRGRGRCCARYWGSCVRRRRGGLHPSRASARCGLVMATEARPFHLVVLGASGFTGQFVVQEVAREQVIPGLSPRLPWAVAGRSREKLQRVVERAALKLGKRGVGGFPLRAGVRVALSERLSFRGLGESGRLPRAPRPSVRPERCPGWGGGPWLWAAPHVKPRSKCVSPGLKPPVGVAGPAGQAAEDFGSSLAGPVSL